MINLEQQLKVCGDKVYQEIIILEMTRYVMKYTLYQVTMR